MSTSTPHLNPARAAHSPGADYAAMNDQELLALRAKHLEDIKRLENPGLLTRLWRRTVQAAGSIATMAGGLWLSEKAFLERERQAHTAPSKPRPAEPQPAGVTPEDTAQNPLQRLPKDLNEPTPDGYERRWSCAGCQNGCPGGMQGQCAPTFVRKDHPDLNAYPPVTDEQMGTFAGGRVGQQFPQAMIAWYQNNPGVERGYEIEGIRGHLPPRNPSQQREHEEKGGHEPVVAHASPHLERQVLFAGVSSTMGTAWVWQWLGNRMNAADSKQAHHLKHEVRHIEDELSFRARLEQQRAAAKPALALAS